METADSLSSPSKSASLTKEQRERIERNREEARKKLLDKANAAQEVLAAYKISNHLANESQPGSSNAPPAKKHKSAATVQMEHDLQDAVSTGTIVRIQGTKLVDTGGGFLLEEKDLVIPQDEELNIVKELAAIAPTDAPKCIECKKDFSESFLYKNFDYHVCDACRDTEEKHGYITRTDAKNDYLLKDVDLDKREPLLRFLLRPNPHNSRWGDMKLYLREQIEQRALEVWGTFEKIEEQHELREENRVKSKAKKFGKKMKALRMEARSSLYTRDLSGHEHTWGPETCIDSDEDTYTHTCTDCGLEQTYEKM